MGILRVYCLGETMKRLLLTIALTISPIVAQCDWNEDGVLNVIDVVETVDCILNDCFDEDIYGCTDPDAINYNPNANIDNGTCEYTSDFEMVLIIGGTFEMGDIWDVGQNDEQPIHTIILDSFEISNKEITNQQYIEYLTEALSMGVIFVTATSVTGPWNGDGNYEYVDLDDSDCQITYSTGNFSVNDGGSNFPMNEVSWYGASAYAEFYGYRLPAESEWEYASRDISSCDDAKWSGTSLESELAGYAWYDENWDGVWVPEDVATKLPNANGLYDMSGNVNEWCNDFYNATYYNESPQSNPQGPSTGSTRVFRGGNFVGVSNSLRCSERDDNYPDETTVDIGFRVAKSLE